MIKKLFNGKNLIILVTALVPALIYALIRICYALKTHGGQSLPLWNDEAVYYALVKQYRVGLVSEGYWGYNAEHAIIGTGAAWNPCLLILYTLISFVIGWSYNTISVCNILIICLCLFLTMKLMDADKRTCLAFVLLSLLSAHIWLYADTQMTELLRYSFAMLLAGFMYRLAFNDENPLWLKVVAGLYVVFLTQAYIFFAFAIPVYVLALLKKKKRPVVKVLIALVVMVAVALPSYYLYHLISCNYDIFRSEQLLECLGRFDIIGMFGAFWQMTKTGLYDLFHCFLGNVGHGMFHVFVPLIAVFTIVPFAMWIYETVHKRAFEKNSMIFLMCFYAMGLFGALYVIVYPLEAFTLFRGIGMPIFFCLTLLIGTDHGACDSKGEKNLSIGAVVSCFAVYALLMIFVPANLKDFNDGRFVSSETVLQWKSYTDKFEKALKVNTSGNTLDEKRWNNTILLYTLEPRVITSLPVGFGQNYMLYSTDVDTRAGYLLISLADEGSLRSDWLEKDHKKIVGDGGEIVKDDYVELFDNGEYVIYKKK